MNDDVLKNKNVLDVYSNGEDIPCAQLPWQSIFNTKTFFLLHALGNRGYYFRYTDAASGNLVAATHFTETAPGRFVSPFRGTFGGYDVADPNLSLLEAFVVEVEKCLGQIGAHFVAVTLRPFSHNPAGISNLYNVLVRLGYQVCSHELSYTQPVLDNELVDRMQRNNQKRLRKCLRENFIFNVSADAVARRAAYDVIAVNRANKGYSISMTFEQVMEMDTLFPSRMHFFNVTHNGKTVAGSVCIAIDPKTLYVFYWGDLPGYETFSPIVLLANGIYDYAKKLGFLLLDVGTSTLNGMPNHGLIRFKENLGFASSLKLGFQKELSNA